LHLEGEYRLFIVAEPTPGPQCIVPKKRAKLVGPFTLSKPKEAHLSRSEQGQYPMA
jgi:hypothetical protein